MFGYRNHVKKAGLSSLILMLILALMSACASKNNTDTGVSSPTSSAASSAPSSAASSAANSAEQESDEPLGLSKYDPPIEVTAVRSITAQHKYREGESLDNNSWSRAYMDELGLRIKYLWTTDVSQYQAKLNTSIASGDLPDIIPVNNIMLQRLVDADAIMDLTDIFKQYATPKTVEILNLDNGRALEQVTFNGKLMALPNISGGLDSGQMVWVREDWRKKLNLPEPKTIADVLKISDAFVNQDPDGNGKKDTYGIALNKDLYGGYANTLGLMHGYHAYNGIWVKDASGQLVYGSIQPEVKTALQTLQDMFKAGQIDPEFAVKDAAKVSELSVSGKVGLHFGNFGSPLTGLVKAYETDPNAVWQSYPVVSADGQPTRTVGSQSATEFYVVTKNAKHPEVVVKLQNLYNEKWGVKEISETYFSSSDGFNHAINALVQATPPGKNIKIYLAIKEALETKNTENLKNVGEAEVEYQFVQQYLAGDTSLWGRYNIFGPDGSEKVLDYYIKNNLYLFDEYTGPPTPTMVEQNAMLKDLEQQVFTKIIMGALPVDDFDKFVSQWNELGGKAITQEVNDWYSSK